MIRRQLVNALPYIFSIPSLYGMLDRVLEPMSIQEFDAWLNDVYDVHGFYG